MTRLPLMLFLALFLPGISHAEVCPSGGAVGTPMAQPPRERHEERIAARLTQLGRALETQNYPAIGLGDSIMRQWPKDLLSQALGVTALLNAGIGGDNTPVLLWRLNNMNWSGQSPRIVLVLIGTNDRQSPPCDVYLRIRAIVARAHQLFPSARIIVSSILPRGEDLLQRDAGIRTTNAALREAAAGSGFSFLDAHEAFLCGHQTPCELLKPPKNVHLTRKGYEVLSGLLKQHVAGLRR